VLRDGEVFFVATASRLDGETTWRTHDTTVVEEILHPENDASVNLWYIVTQGEQRVAIPDAFALFALADRFERVALPQGVVDINQTPQALENGGTYTTIVAAQRNRDERGRGWPEFYDALPWADVYGQMLREYSAVFSAMALYVDKLKIEGGARTVDDIVAQLQSGLVSAAAGSWDSNPTPAAGSTWVENEAISRERMPLGSAAGDAQAGTGIIGQQVASALGLRLADVRADMLQNRSVADIAAQTPTQLWQQYQLFWTSVWQDIVETTLRLDALFNRRQYASYESRVVTSLPMDVETADVVASMRVVNESTAALTLDYPSAARMQRALATLLLSDLGIDDTADILDTPPTTPTETAEVALIEDAGAEQEPDRGAFEDAIAVAVAAVLADFESEARPALEAETQPAFDALQAALLLALLPLFLQVAQQRVDEMMTTYNLHFDEAQIAVLVDEWAERYAAERATQLTATTRNLFARAAAAPDAVTAAQIIQRATSASRAESIGVTEVTAAISAGLLIFALLARRTHRYEFEPRWYTQEDERVCLPICNPLHLARFAVWSVEFPQGPPAHPNCRCYLFLTPEVT